VLGHALARLLLMRLEHLCQGDFLVVHEPVDRLDLRPLAVTRLGNARLRATSRDNSVRVSPSSFAIRARIPLITAAGNTNPAASITTATHFV
jgi:hypothetical protein